MVLKCLNFYTVTIYGLVTVYFEWELQFTA